MGDILFPANVFSHPCMSETRFKCVGRESSGMGLRSVAQVPHWPVLYLYRAGILRVNIINILCTLAWYRLPCQIESWMSNWCITTSIAEDIHIADTIFESSLMFFRFQPGIGLIFAYTNLYGTDISCLLVFLVFVDGQMLTREIDAKSRKYFVPEFYLNTCMVAHLRWCMIA